MSMLASGHVVVWKPNCTVSRFVLVNFPITSPSKIYNRISASVLRPICEREEIVNMVPPI